MLLAYALAADSRRPAPASAAAALLAVARALVDAARAQNDRHRCFLAVLQRAGGAFQRSASADARQRPDLRRRSSVQLDDMNEMFKYPDYVNRFLDLRTKTVDESER